MRFLDDFGSDQDGNAKRQALSLLNGESEEAAADSLLEALSPMLFSVRGQHVLAHARQLCVLTQTSPR